MAVNNLSVIRVYLKHLERYKWRTMLIVVVVMIAEFLGIVNPLFTKTLVDGMTVLKVPISAASFDPLVQILLLILGIQTAAWMLWRFSGFLMSYEQPAVMADLQRSSFAYLMQHSHQFFADHFAGALVRRVQRLSDSFREIVENTVWRFIPIFVALIGIYWVVFHRSLIIGSILLLWLLLFVVIQIGFARWKLPYDLKKATKDTAVTGALADAIGNSSSIQLFTGRAYEMERFYAVTEERSALGGFTWRLGEFGLTIQSILNVTTIFAVMYWALRGWAAGTLSLGDFVLLQIYLTALFSKLFDFARVIRNTYEAFADAREMVEILETPLEIQDAKRAVPLKVTEGKVEFQNVSFSYHRGRNVLSRLNLTIAPREKVALVGVSGAGKSTIVKILFRMYDLDHGRILVDGQSIAKVTQESLREQIALVPQEPALFHRTIMENIRYGRRDATDEEVIAAAKQAHCHEFIDQLPQGYETFVGERGVKLSGGERQRVAIARAILKNAPILVLDEATSSLDSESESLIQDALHKLMRNKTTIVIAHRLSTIMQMDRIVVMGEGNVLDNGTHDDLLKRDGIYQKLWQIQAGGFMP